MYIKEIPDSYMSGILFGKVEVTFSIDLFSLLIFNIMKDRSKLAFLSNHTYRLVHFAAEPLSLFAFLM